MSRVLPSLLVLGGCGASPSSTPVHNTQAEAPPASTACGPPIAGTVHDLDDADAPVGGATIEITRPGATGPSSITRATTTISDHRGAFRFESTDHALRTLTVYRYELVFEGVLPACASNLWLGIHMKSTATTPIPLVVR